MSRRDDGTFSRSEFRFDRKRNVYICPAGATLTTSGRVHSDHAIRYFASVPRCCECPLKQRCCPNTPARRIVRDINEAARDIARRKMKTKAFLKSRDQRKRVEMRFAHLKAHHGFQRGKQAKSHQNTAGMRLHVDADTELADLVRLLEYLGIDAGMMERQRRGHTANAATDNQDLHPFTFVTIHETRIPSRQTGCHGWSLFKGPHHEGPVAPVVMVERGG
jgi:hypothetical protein